jgi:hypothetical protein
MEGLKYDPKVKEQPSKKTSQRLPDPETMIL